MITSKQKNKTKLERNLHKNIVEQLDKIKLKFRQN